MGNDQVWRDTERGGTLQRVDCRQAPAAAGAEVVEPAPGPNPGRDSLDRASHLDELGRHQGGDRAVLGAHEPEQLRHVQAMQLVGTVVDLFDLMRVPQLVLTTSLIRA